MLRALTWRRDNEGLAVATVTADAFCHNMVRALVGALLAVGEGRQPPSWPATVLAAAVRDPAVRVVAPHGLCLEEVGYPADGELAERAAQTRRLRVPVATRPTPDADPGPGRRYPGLPVSILVLRSMLALPVTRAAANCSSCWR